MRYLVTGGAGFIGSHIVERLLKIGHYVRVLDNLSSGKRENLYFTKPSRGSKGRRSLPAGRQASSNFEFVIGDIRDKATCDKACKGIDYVLHQAALRSVPKSMNDPESYNEVNINGTLNMLKSCSKNKVKRLVFASSSSLYGDVNEFPEREGFLPQPISPYALSKLAGEHYCRIFSEFFNLETVCLRYFNVFGPRQALDDEYAVVIPKFIHCILHNQQPPIFGTGRQSRDFTYIDNVVEANILAATRHCEERLPAGKAGSDEAISKAFHDVFNVANGKDHTVLELVGLLNKIIGKSIKPKLLPPRPGDVFRTLADISKIKKMLGFKQKVDFKEGLKRTVEYFQTILVLFLLLFWLGANTACFSQTSPSEVLRSEEILRREEILKGKLQAQEKAFIKKIIVEGAALLSEEEVETIVSPFQKHWLTKDEIKQILTLITQAYTLKSPQQEPPKISYRIKGKELRIKVEEITH